MRIVFTCGGTGGHINPAIAVATLFKERDPSAEILFIGADGMERTLVPKAGFDIETVSVRNIWRSIKPKAVVRNFKTIAGLARSVGEAKAILSRFRPDAVVGTGGYACWPVITAASQMGIASYLHESNAMPGLTAKLLISRVNCVMINFEESRKYMSRASRVELTGTPVRPEILRTRKSDARAALGIGADEKVILSVMGSLGAGTMNSIIADMMTLEKGSVRHIHAAGKGRADAMLAGLRERGADVSRLDIRDYIYDMPIAMAAADIVMCRGGASTLSEVCAVARPSVIVPSPNVTRNHQEVNSRVLERAGAAKVELEAGLTGEKMYSIASQLLADKDGLTTMSKAASKLAVVDASERIYSIITGK